MLLNFHIEISFRYYFDPDSGIYHIYYIGLEYLAFPRSNSTLHHAVCFDCSKGLFEMETFSRQGLQKFLMASF